MSNEIADLKNEDSQMAIPLFWRGTLCEIVDAFKGGDFQLGQGVDRVSNISLEDSRIISKNIEDYGCTLISLPQETWDTSVCQWMRGYWDVLVDLFAEEEGVSDLVLFVRVSEDGSGFSFEVQSVHVP